MARRYPRGRRRRPGRRPPNRYSSGGPSRPQGFTGHGFRSLYDLLLPGLTGYRKRRFFNRVSGSLTLGFALGGAMAGFGLIGPLGGPVGVGVGLVAGAWVAQKGRFYRS